MRDLVNQLSDGGGVRQACDTEEVMVDAEIDGNRYLLVRLRQSDRPQIALSPREHEIARMVAKGHHNKAIAGVLNISSWTVCTHLRRIFAKFGVSSRTAMAARLLEVDIVRERHVAECASPPAQRADGNGPNPAPPRPVRQYAPVRTRETGPRVRRIP
jgi:two-component system, NarL family, nitrate/nitrite response regulator NarL